MSTPSHGPPLVRAREVRTRPSALFHALTGVWALLAAVMCASLGRFGLALVVFLFGAMLGAAWCYRFARALFDREARRRLTGRALAAWAVCPLTGLLFAALSLTPWPYMLRVKVSEPALLRLVENAEGGRANLAPPGRAGLIFVDRVQLWEDCVVIGTENALLSVYGLIYSRTGATPKPGAFHLRHLYGRWYTFSEDID